MLNGGSCHDEAVLEPAMNHAHAELQALAPGYALDILEPQERRMFEAHLTECTKCAAELRSLTAAIDALARSVSQRAPPADLRARVMSSIHGAPSHPSLRNRAALNPWTDRRVRLPVAASMLIALGSHLHVETRLAALAERAEAYDRDMAATRRAIVDARSAVEIIAAPDVVPIDLHSAENTIKATARALWSRGQGMMFASTDLPRLPPDMCHQVWVVTSAQTLSVGILPEPEIGLAVFETPTDIPEPVTVVVTLERFGGAAAPTGPRVLVGTASGTR
jgi:anti-sigma-K factor RskA